MLSRFICLLNNNDLNLSTDTEQFLSILLRCRCEWPQSKICIAINSMLWMNNCVLDLFK